MKVEDNQCQCHVCLQQQGKTISTSLPQHVPPIVPRPGELHLYPHIHGSSGLHSLNRGSHVRPILQPSLYDLHTNGQRKSIIQQGKAPIKLDFDSPEGIHNHINYAYGDWDNSYDARTYLSTKFDSELLPPPPLSSPYTSTFLTEPFSVPGSFASAIPTSSVSSPSAFSSSVNNLVMTTATPTTAKSTDGSSASKETTADSVSKTTKCPNEATGSPTKSHTPPCTRPVTLGGNNMPKLAEKPHSQHCRKHNPQGLAKPGKDVYYFKLENTVNPLYTAFIITAKFVITAFQFCTKISGMCIFSQTAPYYS